MSSRPVFLLLLRVKITGKKRFRLFLPIPLWTALAFADMLGDAACAFRLFGGKRAGTDSAGGRFGAGFLPEAACALCGALWEILFFTGPLDLADIEVRDGENEVAVRCLTR